ncbi:hypothetical protein [Peribacillus sp. NPDC056705]|uniref:hypothetical protein n=1 Tax=Peribacillus sp. NPDC056705 TaxID=3345918 RepID=UPI0037488259
MSKANPYDTGVNRRHHDVQEHPFELRHEVKKLNTRLDQIANTLEKSEMKDLIPKSALLPTSWQAYHAD